MGLQYVGAYVRDLLALGNIYVYAFGAAQLQQPLRSYAYSRNSDRLFRSTEFFGRYGTSQRVLGQILVQIFDNIRKRSELLSYADNMQSFAFPFGIQTFDGLHRQSVSRQIQKSEVAKKRKGGYAL